MDLQSLQQRTGIPIRRLRYVVDHRLVPELYIDLTPHEAGRPRRFAEDVGFGIVCAARLLDLGLPHKVIRRFLDGMLQIELPASKRGPAKGALVAVLEQGIDACAELGDGLNVRMLAPDVSYESPWFAVGNPAPLSKSYRPTVVVTLDLGQIRKQVYSGP